MLSSSKLLVSILSLAGLAVATPKGPDNDKSEMGMGQEQGKHSANFREFFECRNLTRLSKIVDLNNNATAMQIFASKVSPDELQKFKAKAANATTELNALKSNSTLVQECDQMAAKRQAERQCFEIKALQRLVNLGNNATALQELEDKDGNGRGHHRGGMANATQPTQAEIDAKWKEIIANATTKLNQLKSNITLVTACSNAKGANGSTGSSEYL